MWWLIVDGVDDCSVVTPIAGNGAAQNSDGMGTVASFQNPQGLAVDAVGNVYIGTYSLGGVRRVAPSGLVTMLAGSGASQSVDGQGTQASFGGINCLAFANDGVTLIATDYDFHRIRLINTLTSMVTTLAGSRTGQWLDGQGTQASFNQPMSVVVDLAGNVLVADRSNHMIRRISPSGVVSTIAGSTNPAFADGLGSQARFNQPIGLALDGQNTLYVADSINGRIRRVSPSGLVSTVAGNGATSTAADGIGTLATFNSVFDVVADRSGNLFVTAADASSIRQIRLATGMVTTVAGPSGGLGYPARARFTDGANAYMYVTDGGLNRIFKVGPVGGALSACAPGYYGSAGWNTSACAPCALSGSFCPIGALVPVACPAGFACPTGLLSLPVMCAAGSYAALQGASACVVCPVGTFSPGVGATGCVSCPVGQYTPAPGATACADCPVGSYCPAVGPAGATSVVVCPFGAVCNRTGLASVPASLVPCVGGMYCPSVCVSANASSALTSSSWVAGCPLQTLSGLVCPAGA